VTISVKKTLALTAALGAAISPAVFAQERSDAARERGGMIYTLDLSQRLEANTNPSLSSNPKGTVYFSNTRLAFNLSSETRTQKFNLDLSGALRLSDGPETDGFAQGAVDPRIALAYSQYSASSRLDLMASLMRTQINTSSPLRDFTGAAEIAADFDDLTGTGTRDALAFGARLSIWDDAPFGLAFSADISDLSYNNASNPDLTDSTRSRFEVEGRFDISEVMHATAALHYTALDNGVVNRGRTGADFGLTIDQPDGNYGAHARIVDGDAGLQSSILFARKIEQPTSAFTFALGAARATTTDTFAIGYITATHAVADTTFQARAERRLNVDNDDTEEMLTTLSLGASMEVSDYGNLSLDVGYGDSLTLATDDRTTVSRIGVTYTHDISADWSVDATAAYSTRAVTGAADADSTSVALTLRRSFDLRP
jgi:hypothetical protein